MNPKEMRPLFPTADKPVKQESVGAGYEARHARGRAESDAVNHPAHYKTYVEGLETIDMIYAVLGPEQFKGYCRGNALKYIARADSKGKTIEDLEKAIVYLKWEIEVRKSEV